MKRITNIEQNTEEWLDFRRGKIPGSRVVDMYSDKPFTATDVKRELYRLGVDFKKSDSMGNLVKLLPSESLHRLINEAPKKVGFYEVIAERLGIPPDDESPMDRGHRLEPEAAAEFSKRYKKKLREVGCWQSDVDPRIINSPDREVVPKKGRKITEAVEIKCLASSKHIEAVIENNIPNVYNSQIVQYFVVNEALETLYFVFYDPRVTAQPFHCIKITRDDLGDKPEKYLEFELQQLKLIDDIVERLAF